jgi:hypothetical protein
MARTGQTSASAVRAETERCDAARARLYVVMPGWPLRRVRRQILSLLWSGALTPDALMAELRPDGATTPDPASVYASILEAVVSPHASCLEGNASASPNASEARGEAIEAMPPTSRHEAYAHEAQTAMPHASEANGSRHTPPLYAFEAQPIEAKAHAQASPHASELEASPSRGMTLAPIPPAEAARRAAALTVPRAGLTVPIGAAQPRQRRGNRPTLQDLERAVAEGSVDPLKRDEVARHLRVGKTTAQGLVAAYREAHSLPSGRGRGTGTWEGREIKNGDGGKGRQTSAKGGGEGRGEEDQ